jgi:hypothetical protein
MICLARAGTFAFPPAGRLPREWKLEMKIMNWQPGILWIALAACVLTATGCASAPPGTREQTWTQQVAGEGQQAARAMQRSLQSMAGKRSIELPTQWDWVAAIPKQATRGELVQPMLPAEALTAFVPQLPPSEIQLVSFTPGVPLFVSQIDRKKVHHFGQLHSAVEDCLSNKDKGQVRIALRGPNSPLEVEADVSRETLQSLQQAASPEATEITIADEGSSWLLVRRGGVRAKVLCRAERQRGLLHVLLGTKVYWGPPRLLPAEVTATCDSSQLHCLNASQCLEILYGDPAQYKELLKNGSAFFSETSEREDYLLPTNFKILEERVREASESATRMPPLPALASLQGIAYPGSAVLGDSRALGYFLARRTLCHADEPERFTWIIFQGEPVRTKANIQVKLDFGEGPISLDFELPKSP